MPPARKAAGAAKKAAATPPAATPPPSVPNSPLVEPGEELWRDDEGNPLPVSVLLGYIVRDLPPIGKNQENTEQRFMFRGHDDVMNFLNPLLGRYGVFIVPNVLERVVDRRATRSGGVMYEVNLHVEFMATGPGGDYIRGTAWGEGTDMGDKATNKAMTNAIKYWLVQLFGISTREVSETDADRHSPEETIGSPDRPCNICGGIVKDAALDVENMRVHYIGSHGWVRLSDGSVAKADSAQAMAEAAERAAAADTTGDAPTPPADPTPAATTPEATTPEPPATPDVPADPQAGDDGGDNDEPPEDEDIVTKADIQWVLDAKKPALVTWLNDHSMSTTGNVGALQQRIIEFLAPNGYADDGDSKVVNPPGGRTDHIARVPDPLPEGWADPDPDYPDGVECPGDGETECKALPFPNLVQYEWHWEQEHETGEDGIEEDGSGENPDATDQTPDDPEEPPEDPAATYTPPDAEMIDAIKAKISALSGQTARAYAKERKEKGYGRPEDLSDNEAKALIAFLEGLEG